MSEVLWAILFRFINARFRVGRLFGVLFTINHSLIVVPIAVAVYCWPDFRLFCGLMSFCMGIAASLLFHEICHALAGRCAGRHAREIGLMPIGGFTLFKQFPERGGADIFVSLAGPLGNGLICVGLIVLEIGLLDGGINERFAQIVELLYDGDTTMDNISFLVVWSNAVLRINLILFVFNLMPAFPLDGGKFMRIILAHFMPMYHATVVAVFISRIIAIGIMVYTIADVIIGSACVIDIPIALLMSVLIWCVSGMELMRAKYKASRWFLESSPVSNKESAACSKAVSMPPTECEVAVQ